MASGYMFSHYWPGDGVEGTPPPADPNSVYYPYMFLGSSVSAFGAGAVNWEGMWIRLRRKLPNRLVALWQVLRLIFSPRFTAASVTVRQIAQTPESRNIKWWADVDRLAVSNPAHGENTYRALLAATRLGGRDAATLIELAALAFRTKGR